MANNWTDVPTFVADEIVTATKMNYVKDDLGHLGGLLLGDGVTELRDANTGAQIIIPVPTLLQLWGGTASGDQYLGINSNNSGGVAYLHFGFVAVGVPTQVNYWYRTSGAFATSNANFELRYHKTGVSISTYVATLSNQALYPTVSTQLYKKNITSLFANVTAGDMCNLRLDITNWDASNLYTLAIEVKYW